MEAVILAGGLGTRLREIVADAPKSMAQVCGRPFLSYLLDQLQALGIKKVVLATGYRHALLADHFGSSYGNISLAYSVESEPLGTGGAIAKALQLCTSENVLVLNGDTFFAVEFKEMMACHLRLQADISVALKEMVSFDRYGSVTMECGRIVAFHEKKMCDRGYINGGVYIVRKSLFTGLGFPERFSFEEDFLGKYLHSFMVAGFKSDGYFIDIGIPEDYARAGRDFVSFMTDAGGYGIKGE